MRVEAALPVKHDAGFCCICADSHGRQRAVGAAERLGGRERAPGGRAVPAGSGGLLQAVGHTLPHCELPGPWLVMRGGGCNLALAT